MENSLQTDVLMVFVASPHATLRRKSKDCLARNKKASTIKIQLSVGLDQRGPHHHLIENYLVLAMTDGNSSEYIDPTTVI